MSKRRQTKIVYIDDYPTAKALANLLWNEKERHLDDIRQIRKDLKDLSQKFKVRPAKTRVFLKVIEEIKK